MDGYYNSLLSLFDKGVEEGFIDAKERNIFVLADTAAELLTKLTEARLASEDEDAAAGGGEAEEKGAAAAAGGGVKRKRN